MAFWEHLSAVINNNPVHERDLFFMAMLKPLGIEKGKEFKPDHDGPDKIGRATTPQFVHLHCSAPQRREQVRQEILRPTFLN